MKIELNGEVAFIGQTTEVGTNKFQVRELLLTTDKEEEYPQLIAIQAVGGKTSIFDGLSVGDEISLKASLNGRGYQAVNKPQSAINQINAWKVDIIKSNGSAPVAPAGGSIVVDPAISPVVKLDVPF